MPTTTVQKAMAPVARWKCGSLVSWRASFCTLVVTPSALNNSHANKNARPRTNDAHAHIAIAMRTTDRSDTRDIDGRAWADAPNSVAEIFRAPVATCSTRATLLL